jgi:peptidoglycan-associated lipoprotein
MKRKNLVVVMMFACLSLLVMTSCAKKQIQSPEVADETAGVTSPAFSTDETDDVTVDELKAEEINAAKRLEMEIQQFEASDIYFDFDKSDISPEGRNNLKQKADWLLNHPSYTALISGHCDERGTNEYNLALGERRAFSAKKILKALGVSPDRIATISYGEERPADPGHNEAAWSKNRRDAFKLTK